ncbi:MAG: aminoglycoside phosphotransferase family protein [Gaiellaceae bacterium]
MSFDEWRARAPDIVEEVAELWSLRLGTRYELGHASMTFRAELPDGTPAVLKVGFPHPEAEHEAAALAIFDGRGAVRLLAHDPERNALLLERCEPGNSLLELPDEDESFSLAAGVLRRLWRPPAPEHPFDLLADLAAGWAQLPGLDAGVVGELASSQGELVVCHQDFHRGNVLRAQREPWLAIDPKPIVGEREFDTAALLRDDPGDLARRLDLLAAELGLDRARMRLWGIVHAVAWEHPEVARALAAA